MSVGINVIQSVLSKFHGSFTIYNRMTHTLKDPPLWNEEKTFQQWSNEINVEKENGAGSYFDDTRSQA